MSSDRVIGVVAVVILVATLVAILIRLRPQSDSGRRLVKHWRDRKGYLMFVGMPPEAPATWVRVAAIDESEVTLHGGRRLKLSEITAYFVTYPSKTIFDYRSPTALPVPEWVNGLQTTALTETDTLTLDDLKDGKALVRVAYGKSTSQPSSPDHYSTTLTNLSYKRVRVLKFGGYAPQNRTFLMMNAARRFYTAEEFKEWYGQKGEWIGPGQSVKDPNNYGSRPMLWAYYLEVQGGQRCWTGEVNF